MGGKTDFSEAEYNLLFQLLRQNKSDKIPGIYIHCEGGIGRVAILVLAVMLMQDDYKRFIEIFNSDAPREGLCKVFKDLRSLRDGLLHKEEQLWDVYQILINHFIPQELNILQNEFQEEEDSDLTFRM